MQGKERRGALRYWSGQPFPSPGDLPDPGIEPTSLTSPALAGGFFTTSITWDVSELQVPCLCPADSQDCHEDYNGGTLVRY